MKVKFKQIVSSVTPFRELSESKFPPKTSLDIYKIGKELDRELVAYQDLSKKVYTLHKIPVDDNGNYDLKGLKKEEFEKFFKDLEELLNLEVEVNGATIDLDTLERFNISISPSTLSALDWLFGIAEEEKVAEESEEESEEAAATA